MQGEFRGDFTRDSFNPLKHFSRVFMQQGRVQLDADWNEQTAILLHYLQLLAADLIGPYGGNGFEISFSENSITIGSGHYYVDGILCENDEKVDYYNQKDYPIDKNTKPLPSVPFLVYLDVWERHISYIEDDSIREVALNGFDTATRAKIIWQVKVDKLAEDIDASNIDTNWAQLVKKWQPAKRGQLRAKGQQKANTDTSPCITSSTASYQGAENQLYRVEIHTGGTVGDGATFKWSRENSAIAFPVIELGDKTITVDSAGRDSVLGLSSKQWVELIDDTHELLGKPGTLVQIVKVEGQVLTFDTPIPQELIDLKSNPKLRRWDYQGKDPKNGDLQLSTADNALLIKEVKTGEGQDQDNWLTLKDGIQIQFQPGATYRSGDYWLIPARTATGDILWEPDPSNSSLPTALPPHGTEHHFAPLAIIFPDKTPDQAVSSCQKAIKPLAVGSEGNSKKINV